MPAPLTGLTSRFFVEGKDRWKMDKEKAMIADYLSSAGGQKQLLKALKRRNERIQECMTLLTKRKNVH